MNHSGLKGTWRLVRLALRRDRIKLPLWIFVIVAMVGGSLPALSEFYGTVEQRIEFAAATAPSVIGRAFGGPVEGPSLGSIVMVELFVFTAVLIAFMSTLLVVRHTRQNEELGASELIGSAVVGRYAQLAAALILAIGLNLLVGLLLFVVLSSSSDLSTVGTLGMSAAWALTGIVFAGIAAVASQVAESTRGANGMAGGAIGAFFIIRAVGDGFGTVSPDGLSATSAWPTWLSPFGLGYLVRPFTAQNWWILGVLALLSLILVSSAVLILRRRDVGSGLIATRPGLARAKGWLLSPLGLAWRLQRGVLYGWLIGFAIYGLIVGGMANEFSEMIVNNEAAKEYISSIGGTGDINDTFFAAMFSMGSLIASGYALQALLRLRSEEVAGYLESLLGTATSRLRWASSHILVALLGTISIMLVFGFTSGISNMLIGDGDFAYTLKLTASTLVQAPAIIAFGSFVLLVFGLLPGLVIGLAWGAFVLSMLINQLGALLKLPDWAVDISPFTHLPLAPSGDITIKPLIVLLLVGAAMATLGLLGLKRRDITTS